jgi:hypothetical protein
MQILPSPTTGSFAPQRYNWLNNSEENHQIANETDKSFSNFSFQNQQGPAVTGSNTTFQSSTVVGVEQVPSTIVTNFKCIYCIFLFVSIHGVFDRITVLL